MLSITQDEGERMGRIREMNEKQMKVGEDLNNMEVAVGDDARLRNSYP